MCFIVRKAQVKRHRPRARGYGERGAQKSLPTTSGPMNVGSTASLPLPGVPDASQSIVLRTADGEVIEVAEQVQLYAPNVY
jgi:hypothetical protein